MRQQRTNFGSGERGPDREIRTHYTKRKIRLFPRLTEAGQCVMASRRVTFLGVKPMRSPGGGLWKRRFVTSFRRRGGPGREKKSDVSSGETKIFFSHQHQMFTSFFIRYCNFPCVPFIILPSSILCLWSNHLTRISPHYLIIQRKQRQGHLLHYPKNYIIQGGNTLNAYYWKKKKMMMLMKNVKH